MTSQDRTKGAVAIIIVVAILLLGALGFVGWRALSGQNKSEQASTKPTETTAEVIMTQEDLEAAEKSLDELDFSDDEAEAAELEASL